MGPERRSRRRNQSGGRMGEAADLGEGLSRWRTPGFLVACAEGPQKTSSACLLSYKEVEWGHQLLLQKTGPSCQGPCLWGDGEAPLTFLCPGGSRAVARARESTVAEACLGFLVP